ncbi:OmpA family protein [Alphaproteobacteria bacterium]|nr:OmpA family protein [Alphaproteobacteria bacterium]
MGGGGTGGLLGGQSMSSSGKFFEDQITQSSISFSDITPMNSDEEKETSGIHDFERQGSDEIEMMGTSDQDPILSKDTQNEALHELRPDDQPPNKSGTKEKKKTASSDTEQIKKIVSLKKLGHLLTDGELKMLLKTENVQDIKRFLKEELPNKDNRRKEMEAFEAKRKALEKAILEKPEFAGFKDHVIIDMTPEGLRIQLVDRKNKELFPNGSAKMHDYTRGILTQIAEMLKDLPNKLSITGHTDAKPFFDEKSYGNWELSSDRALESRTIFVNAVGAERIARVTGKAETDLLNKENPYAPENRRIGIVLLHKDIDRALSSR